MSDLYKNASFNLLLFFFLNFELLPPFFIFTSQYTSFLHIPSISAFSCIILNRDRFRMGDIWAVFVLNLYSVHRLSCKGSSFVLINSVSPEPSTVSSTQSAFGIYLPLNECNRLWFHDILNFQITKAVSWVQSLRGVSENCTRIWCMVHLERK